MYRVNLYPEYADKRRLAKKQVGHTALITAVVAVEFLLVATIGITGFLLKEQATTLRGEVSRLSQQVDGSPGLSPDIGVALKMLEIRRSRVNWSPKLASLSENIDRSLRLTEVKGQTKGKGRQTGLEVTGVIRTGTADMQTVSLFIDALRTDPRVGGDFPNIRLGNLEGGGARRFQVVCGRGKETS